MPNPVFAVPLPGCVTIDSATPNDYLDYARVGNPHAGANGTTAVAASNLLACEQLTPNVVATLVGHGMEGDIDTGSAAGECITLNNQAAWGPALATLSTHITEFYLFGCSVGAGPDGAQLLWEIAKVVTCPVYAPTGLIYCDDTGHFSLEAGAQWQRATPTDMPAPIDPPVAQVQDVVMSAAGTKDSANPPAAGQISAAQYIPTSARGDGEPLSNAVSVGLAKVVEWTPVNLPGAHGGKMTGTFSVTYGKTGALITRRFKVYNHTLLQDMEDATIFYRALPAFRDFVKGH